MDAESLKPDAMILVGLIGAWLGALLLFTPIYAVMTESPASLAEFGAFTLGDLDDLCDSSLGTWGRMIDQEVRQSCSRVGALLVFSYLAVAIGVALLVGGFLLKQSWGAELGWYVGFGVVLVFVFVLFASYHIEAIPVADGVMYQGRFF